MTKRDWFAALGMIGMISSGQWNTTDNRKLAEWAFEIADRMIEISEKK